MLTTATKYTLTGVEGSFELRPAGISDLVAFERFFKMPSSALQVEVRPVVGPDGEQVLNDDGTPRLEAIGEFRLEWICFLAWRDAARRGLINKDVTPFDDDFLERLDIIDETVLVDDEPEGPTQLDPSEPAPRQD